MCTGRVLLKHLGRRWASGEGKRTSDTPLALTSPMHRLPSHVGSTPDWHLQALDNRTTEDNRAVGDSPNGTARGRWLLAPQPAHPAPHHLVNSAQATLWPGTLSHTGHHHPRVDTCHAQVRPLTTSWHSPNPSSQALKVAPNVQRVRRLTKVWPSPPLYPLLTKEHPQHACELTCPPFPPERWLHDCNLNLH